MLSTFGGGRAVSLSQVCFFAVASLKGKRVLLLDLRGTQGNGLGLPESLLQSVFMSLGLEAQDSPVRKPGAILSHMEKPRLSMINRVEGHLGYQGWGGG